MSLLHRDRKPTLSEPRPPSNALIGGRLRWRSAVAGGSAAVVSMLTIALPALLAWVASAESTVEWTRALSVGSSAWLLANGAHLVSGTATISLMPWLLTAIPLVIATIAARRIVVQLGDGRPRRFQRWGGLRRDVADAAFAFIASYAGIGLLVALVTSSHPLHATLPSAVIGTTVVGVVAVLAGLSLEFRGDIASVAPDLAVGWDNRVSIHLRRAIRPGLWGAAFVFGAGLVLVIGVLATNLGSIGRLYDAVGADPVGVGVLSLGQVLALPNAAVWAASWLVGPGFGFGEGSSITWSHSDPGLLPLIPGLGALPAPGPMASGLWLVVLVPVLAGGLVGLLSVREVARLSSLKVKAKVAVAGCLVSAAVLALGGTMAGGSLGANRLSSVGVPPLLFGGAVLGELLLGTAVVVGLSHLRAARH